MSRLSLIALVASLFVLVGFGGSHTCGWLPELAKFGEPEFECVGTRQKAAGKYSDSAFAARAGWQEDQGDAERAEELLEAAGECSRKFLQARNGAWPRRPPA